MGKRKRQKEKSSKLKHSRRRRDSSSSDSSSSEDEWVEKEILQKQDHDFNKTKRKHGKRSTSASTNSISSEDEWVEKTSKPDRKDLESMKRKTFHNRRRNSSTSSFSEDESSEKEARKTYKNDKNKQNKNTYDKRRRNSSTSSSEDEGSEMKAKEKYKNDKNKQKYEKRKNSSASSSSDAKRTDKNNKHKITKSKYEKRRRDSSTSSSSSEYTLIEKRETSKTESALRSDMGEAKNKGEDWLSFATSLSTASHVDRRQDRNEAKQKEKESQQYDPRRNVRELNPYWKSGGDGLPSLSAKRKFAKPADDDDSYYHTSRRTSNWRKTSSGGYKKPEHKPNYNREFHVPREDEKKQTPTRASQEKEKSTVTSANDEQDLELNEIAAKLIKAEILGNTDLVKKLKEKLEIARQNKTTSKQSENKVMLVKTDSKGLTVPLRQPKESLRPSIRKADTHESSGRSSYYADDDEPSLKEMFESAKFNSTTMDEKDFMESAIRTRKGGDFDDVFVDKIRNSKNTESAHKKMRDSAVAEYQKDSRVLENCNRCIQNENMAKNLMISMGDSVYLTLPSHEPLTENHCLLSPIRHITCSTQMDENEWEELMNFRKSITRMFASEGLDVIFYETMYSNSRSHMYISCVPVPKESGDLAPIYFKKAIEECETEWSVNKKLINLAGKDVRKAVPKGLPYFFVSFGMNEGFAHVIEDKRDFPKYFASEVIGGILDIPHTIWRYPKEQDFKKQQIRVLNFSKVWSEYDCTKNN